MGYKLYRLWAIFLAVLLTVFVLLFISSCNSKKKFVKYAALHKEELAELCSENFKPETKIIEGRTDTTTKIEYKDSVIVNCPPVEAKTGQIIRSTTKCPPTKIITNTFTRVDTLKVANTAKEYALQSKLTKSEKDNKKLTDGKAKWRLQAILLYVVSGALLWLFLAKR